MSATRKQAPQPAKFSIKLAGLLAAAALGGSLFLLAVCVHPGAETVKLTVNVNDNGKIVSSSGVFRFDCGNVENHLGEWGRGSCNIRGEAIPIDIPGKGTAFLVMTGGREHLPRGMVTAVFKARPGPQAQSWNLEPDNLPTLVGFRNLNDPKTVTVIEPSAIGRWFGAGVALVSVCAEITNEPVTRGRARKHLAWLPSADLSELFSSRQGGGEGYLVNSLQPYSFGAN